MILNPWVGELFVKLIFINFLMQLLSTFEHALKTFATEKNYTEHKVGYLRVKLVKNIHLHLNRIIEKH